MCKWTLKRYSWAFLIIQFSRRTYYDDKYVPTGFHSEYIFFTFKMSVSHSFFIIITYKWISHHRILCIKVSAKNRTNEWCNQLLQIFLVELSLQLLFTAILALSRCQRIHDKTSKMSNTNKSLYIKAVSMLVLCVYTIKTSWSWTLTTWV